MKWDGIIQSSNYKKQGSWDGLGMWHTQGRRYVYAKDFLPENLKE